MSKLRTAKGNESSGEVSLGLAAGVLAGRDGIVSFDGTSQFTAQGVSACGLAAFNFARIGFRTEQSGRTMTDIVNELGSRQLIEEIVAICAGWSNDLHLEVDDLYHLPIFERSLKLVSIEYARPRPKQFMKLLNQLLNIEKSAVMIITRPPEIIACFKFAKASSSPNESPKPVFVIFDSHPRPSHPQGAGLSFSTSVESTARTLSGILPPVDESLWASPDFQWQAQLLANCSGHIFVANDQRGSPEDSVIQSSLDVLSLRAKVLELNRSNETLLSDIKRLELKVEHLTDAIRQKELRASQAAEAARSALPTQAHHGRSFGRYSHAIPGSSRLPGVSINGMQKHNPSGEHPSPSAKVQPDVDRPSRRSDLSLNGTQKQSTNNVFADFLPADPAKARPVSPAQSRHRASGGARSIFADNPPPIPAENPHAYEDLFEMDANTAIDDLSAAPLKLAQKLQLQYDLEDVQLRQEHADLIRRLQTTFPCGICLDEQSEESIARVDGCSHTMCRGCLRDFVRSKIQEHRFPIFCPICTAANDREPIPISRFLIEQLGITEEDFQILTEMELAEFTIQIHCRRCKRSAFVDRQDYSEVPNIVCPQPDCNNVWCKKCEQSIVIGGPKHSCDGTTELDHLMKENGWKHCPNCTTPILKESGCNHMTCISPGCNTHFCYVCGGKIVRSALRDEVENATTAHYRSCQLFEVPD